MKSSRVGVRSSPFSQRSWTSAGQSFSNIPYSFVLNLSRPTLEKS